MSVLPSMTRRGLGAGLVSSLAIGGVVAVGGDPALAQTKKIVVNLWVLSSTPWELMTDRFQKANPNVEIRLTKYGTDAIKEALRVAASSGSMPDAWYNWGGSLASSYEKDGLALDLTDRLAKDGLDKQIIPSAFRLAALDGRLYGVPYRITPVSFIYRKSLFAKIGVQPPKTFAELEDIAAKLKAAGITPFSIGGKYSWLTMRFTDFLLEHFAGPDLNDKLMSLQVSWNRPEVIAAFAKIQEWTQKGYFPPGFLSVDPMQDMTPMFDGSAAMVIETPSAESTRIIPAKLDPADFGTFMDPTDHTPHRVSGFINQIQVSASAHKDVQEAAISFAEFVVGKQVMQETLPSFGGPSTVLGVMPPDNLAIQSQWAKWLQGDVGLYLIGDQALPQPVVTAYWGAQDGVALGSVTPKDAAAQVQTAIEAWKAGQ